MNEPIIRAQGLRKSFRRGPETITPFDQLDCVVARGSFTALMGPSGSGKTTLLHCLAGIDRPDDGQLVINGDDVMALATHRLPAWRARTIGCVFQQHHLLPVLNARENVELPLLLRKMSAGERRQKARAALALVGLADREGHLPRQLSGGQEQRVAIARALVADAPLLVADEPTGNLDADNGVQVMDLLRSLVDDHGKTVLMVTHDHSAAARADHIFTLDHGRLVIRDAGVPA